MVCPICNKHKAKRLCPARGESICSTCCGTEREVTIDCPGDCTYLIASRDYDLSRLSVDGSKLPFPESKFQPGFAREHRVMLTEIDYALCRYAADHREVVDSDVFAALHALAETYRTQSSGIIYEKPPDYALQRGLYEAIRAAIKKFREETERKMGMAVVRDSEIRDVLIYHAQLSAIHNNGRPKGRAYLDLLREQFPKEEFQKTASNIVLL